MADPKPLEAFKDLFLKSEEIRKLVTENFGLDSEERMKQLQAGQIDNLLDLIEENKFEMSGSPEDMWDYLSKFLTSVRSISMDTAQSTLALNSVLRLPEAKPEDKKARIEGLKDLCVDFSKRLTGYPKEIGPNTLTPSRPALASPSRQRAAVCIGSVRATKPRLTDIAARPPESAYFQKDRDTLEKRSGRWLKDLARQNQTAGFDLNGWISKWEGGSGRQIPGRN
jgi:hypothetical protein